jgi:hypothetical protein
MRDESHVPKIGEVLLLPPPLVADDGVHIPKLDLSSEIEIHHYEVCFLNYPLCSPINVC